MDRPANEELKKQERHKSNLSFAIGLTQTNRRAKEKMKNENEEAGWLIGEAPFKLGRNRLLSILFAEVVKSLY
jgi:hypothetical protein